MTAVLAVFGGVAGFIAGPVLVAVARRSLDRDAPLFEPGDVELATGRSADALRMRATAARLVVAAVAVGVVLTIGVRFTLAAYLWFVAVTVVLTVTDVEAKLIPNRITLPGGVVGGALLIVGALLDGDPERVVWAAIGAAGYFVFMLVLALIVPGGLGFGDVKLAPILGGFVAAEHLGYVLIAALGSYVIGGGMSALLLITRLKSRKDTIPFGPYMVIAAYIALFAGQAIVDWYLR